MILKGNHQHETGHTFDVVEKPESLDKLLNPTLPISCIYCSMYPILGNIFFCEECSDIYFCMYFGFILTCVLLIIINRSRMFF